VRLRLGSRGSRLALRQADSVAMALDRAGVAVEIVQIRTSGDRLTEARLAEIGGKGLFVKEIEEALVACRVDVGVHSLKDMPAVQPPGLEIGGYAPRGDPHDVLVAREPGGLDALRPGATVGTGSPRRQVLLAARRPDLRIEPIRGNVDTRLEKLRRGVCDALVLARAGLNRLGVEPDHVTPLDPQWFVPAVGQGIIALEIREADREVLELLRLVDHTETRVAAEAERGFLARLGADCHTPVAAFAEVEGNTVTVTGLVASIDGATMLKASVSGCAGAAAESGARLADLLLARGAGNLLGTQTEPRE
jgi:hydroxymethylbilane synthase